MRIIPKFQVGKDIQMTTGEKKKLVGWKPNGDSRFIDNEGNETEGTLQLPEVEVVGNKPNSFLQWLTNATLSAAINENAAVAAASGWKLGNGKWVLKPDKESDKLAENLAIISTFSPTNPSNILGNGIVKGIEWSYKMANPILPKGTKNFGELSKYLKHKIGEGAEATVLYNTPNKVAKVIYSGYLFAKNRIPHVEQVKYIGNILSEGLNFPVYALKKLKTITNDVWPQVLKRLDLMMTSKGFRIVNDPKVQYRAYRNNRVVVDDISPDNVGLNWRGYPRIIDFNYQTIPEWLELGFKLKLGGVLNF